MPVSGAAAFFAMREYEKHQAENGQPPSHEFAKELMAGIAGAEVRPFCSLLSVHSATTQSAIAATHNAIAREWSI